MLAVTCAPIETGPLRPFRNPVYSAVPAGGLPARRRGGGFWWNSSVGLNASPSPPMLCAGNGHADCVELGPCGTLERAIRFLCRDEVEIECFPTASAPVLQHTVRQC